MTEFAYIQLTDSLWLRGIVIEDPYNHAGISAIQADDVFADDEQFAHLMTTERAQVVAKAVGKFFPDATVVLA